MIKRSIILSRAEFVYSLSILGDFLFQEEI